MKEKPTIETFLIPPRKPQEYGEFSMYQNKDPRLVDYQRDPIRTNFENSLVLRQRLAYSYSEYVTHTVLHKISTIQWLPTNYQDEQSTSYHQFLLGTCDNDPEEYQYERNYLYVFGFAAPKEGINGKIEKCRIQKFEMKGFAPFKSPTVLKKIYVKDGLKLARYMPQKSTMIATMGQASNQMNIFDTVKHPKVPKSIKSKPKPNVLLSTGGQSILTHFDWNSMKQGSIAGGCDNGTVSVWDINSKKIQSDKETKPLESFEAFPGTAIQNVFWHPFSSDILAVSSEAGDFAFFDTRQSPEEGKCSAIHSFRPEESTLTTFSLSPLHEHLFATGSSESSVKLWDLRNMKKDIFTVTVTDPVTQVQFSPHCAHMLAASTHDPSVVLLNMNKAGRIQLTDKHSAEGMAETQFVHFQRQNITDFCWGPPEHPWRMASVDGSFAFYLWTPSYKCVYENI